MRHHRYESWRAMHHGKRRYNSRWRAWLVVIRIWLRERRFDALEPYTCRWGPDWNAGRTAAPHIHIGHGKHTLTSRARHLFNRRVVWPLYRVRARCRKRRARSGTT